VDGRIEDSFVAADGRIIPLPSTVVDDLTGLVEAQIAQLGQGRFEIRMVPGTGYDPDVERGRALRNVERLIGPGQIVTFRTMDRLPRSNSGKLRPAIVVADGPATDGA
jgi:phenylacetate-CoA ligase